MRLQEPVHRSGQTDALGLQLMVRVKKIGNTYCSNNYLFDILLCDKLLKKTGNKHNNLNIFTKVQGNYACFLIDNVLN